jgi:hypothetical protein
MNILPNPMDRKSNIRQTNSFVEHESFHQAIGPCLVLSQFFGMLPVQGIMDKSENNLKFEWKSVRTFYALLFLLFGGIDSATGIRRFFRLGFNIKFAEALLYFLSAIIRAGFLLKIATKWQEIMMKFHECEKSFLHHPYEKKKGLTLTTRIRVFFFTNVLGSVSEYFQVSNKLIKLKTKFQF